MLKEIEKINQEVTEKNTNTEPEKQKSPKKSKCDKDLAISYAEHQKRMYRVKAVNGLKKYYYIDVPSLEYGEIFSDFIFNNLKNITSLCKGELNAKIIVSDRPKSLTPKFFSLYDTTKNSKSTIINFINNTHCYNTHICVEVDVLKNKDLFKSIDKYFREIPKYKKDIDRDIEIYTHFYDDFKVEQYGHLAFVKYSEEFKEYMDFYESPPVFAVNIQSISVYSDNFPEKCALLECDLSKISEIIAPTNNPQISYKIERINNYLFVKPFEAGGGNLQIYTLKSSEKIYERGFDTETQKCVNKIELSLTEEI